MDRKIVARFRSKIDKNGPMHPYRPELGRCHLWTGSLRAHYGQFSVCDRPVRAHRMAFYLAHGRWPEPCALHSCDRKLCVNDAHLFEGTTLDNSRDCVAKGRHVRGELHRNSKLTEQDVRDIRANYALCRVSQRALAKRFGVSSGLISHIVLRRTWAHV